MLGDETEPYTTSNALISAFCTAVNNFLKMLVRRMAATMLLDRSAWDLALTANGDWAVATEPYSQVQDAASACRLLEAEQWYDTTIGIPYYQQILGQFQPIQVLQEKLSIEAASVPGVLAARAVLDAIVDRSLSGQVQITTETGTETVIL